MVREIQIRARMISSDVAEIKVLITHVMETGTRKDPQSKKTIPAHYITEVIATLNSKTVITAQWGPGLAKNPFLGFKVKGAKPGDYVAIKAIDNLGGKLEHDTMVI